MTTGLRPQDRKPCRAAEDGDAALRLELRGLRCPLPAIRTHKALSRLPPGSRVDVLADDPLAALDIAHLCRAEGHALVETVPIAGGALRFSIERGPDRA